MINPAVVPAYLVSRDATASTIQSPEKNRARECAPYECAIKFQWSGYEFSLQYIDLIKLFSDGFAGRDDVFSWRPSMTTLISCRLSSVVQAFPA